MELVARRQRPHPGLARPVGAADPGLDLDAVSEVLARVRRAKTEAKRSQRSAVARLAIHAPDTALVAIRAAHDDLVDALTVTELVIESGDELTVDVGLEAPPPQ